jgi:N-acetylglucosaminyl-diphospho-decaprenol L-rhamnosyltransferase
MAPAAPSRFPGVEPASWEGDHLAMTVTGRPDLPEVQVQVVVYKSHRWWKTMATAVDLLSRATCRTQLTCWDNDPGSTFADGSELASSHSAWTYHPSPRGNQGFGKAHNALAEMAPDSCTYLLLLNPDTIPFFDSLDSLVRIAEANPRAAMVEAVQFPVEHPKEYDPNTLETNWCSAACLLVRLAAFKAIGGFDPALHLYCEDVDLSWRAWLGGWTCLYAPSAKCVHVSSHLDPARSRSTELLYSLVGDLYLRRKYFGDEAARDRLAGLRADLAPRFLERITSMADTLPGVRLTPRLDPHITLDPPGFYGPRRW